jgi:hypothetical protein
MPLLAASFSRSAAISRLLTPPVSGTAAIIAAPASFLREPSAVRAVPAATHRMRRLAGCAARGRRTTFISLRSLLATWRHAHSIRLIDRPAKPRASAKGRSPRYNDPFAAAASVSSATDLSEGFRRVFQAPKAFQRCATSARALHPICAFFDQARSIQ